MFKNYELLFGIISTISIILYASKYILHDLYAFCSKVSTKAKINNILPFLSKNNTLFISLSLIFAGLHIYSLNSFTTIFNSGYLVLGLVIFLIIVKIFNQKFIDLKQYLTMMPYLLLLSLLVHLYFR